jgi:hypothetical protein
MNAIFDQLLDLVWQWSSDLMMPRHKKLVREWAMKQKLALTRFDRQFLQLQIPAGAPPAPFPFETQGLYRAHFRSRTGEKIEAWVLVGNKWHPFASNIETIFD